MENFATTVAAKVSILDACGGPECLLSYEAFHSTFWKQTHGKSVKNFYIRQSLLLLWRKVLFKIPVSFYPDATNKIHFLKNASGILETLLKIVLLFKCIFYESWVTFLFVYEIFVISWILSRVLLLQ